MALRRLTTVLTILAAAVSAHLSVNTELNKVRHREVGIKYGFKERNAQPIFAYEGLPLDTAPGGGFERVLDILDTDDPDFGMITLIRIMFLSDMHANYSYDDVILPKMKEFDYWPVKGSKVPYAYWSENHLVMWLSTQYLLRQRQGWPTDDELLDTKLQHWLDLKLKYGFYEWNSNIYWGYTLSAMLNLADFAKDEKIRADAEAATFRLYEEMLQITNDQGVWFPVTGRGKYNKYYKPVHDHMTPCIWILTELNEEPTFVSQASAAMATSRLNFEPLVEKWSPKVDKVVQFGHAINDKIHEMLPRQDRTFFQWSAGGYYHPDVAKDTGWTSQYYDLETIPSIPDWLADLGSNIGATFSRGSVLSKATHHYYVNRGVTLSSAENYYAGYYGYQQYPMVANVHDVAVWTQSGKVKTEWDDRDGLTINTHLPWVIQRGNMAMMMYWPNLEIRVGFDTHVTLHWKDEWFDKVVTHNNWIIARRVDSYVAVYRYGTDTDKGWYSVDKNNGRQLWAIVVGNADLYGGFDEFVETIRQAEVREKYSGIFSKTFEASVTVGNATISNKWS